MSDQEPCLPQQPITVSDGSNNRAAGYLSAGIWFLTEWEHDIQMYDASLEACLSRFCMKRLYDTFVSPQPIVGICLSAVGPNRRIHMLPCRDSDGGIVPFNLLCGSDDRCFWRVRKGPKWYSKSGKHYSKMDENARVLVAGQAQMAKKVELPTRAVTSNKTAIMAYLPVYEYSSSSSIHSRKKPISLVTPYFLAATKNQIYTSPSRNP